MSEPTTAGLAGIGLGKLLGISVGAILAAVVVMAMTLPKTSREWVAGLISTLVSSICGGAGVVQWLGFTSWVDTFEGTVAMIGLCFACGLPAWVFVRAWFAYAAKSQGTSLIDMIKEIREALGR